MSLPVAGEIAQWLRAQAALLEDLGSIPSIHPYDGSGLSVTTVKWPLLATVNTKHASGTQMGMQEKHPYIWKNGNLFSLETLLQEDKSWENISTYSFIHTLTYTLSVSVSLSLSLSHTHTHSYTYTFSSLGNCSPTPKGGGDIQDISKHEWPSISSVVELP